MMVEPHPRFRVGRVGLMRFRITRVWGLGQIGASGTVGLRVW